MPVNIAILDVNQLSGHWSVPRTGKTYFILLRQPSHFSQETHLVSP